MLLHASMNIVFKLFSMLLSNTVPLVLMLDEDTLPVILVIPEVTVAVYLSLFSAFDVLRHAMSKFAEAFGPDSFFIGVT